jgi:LuxR family maltose regulon positive regulatory protein
MEKQWYQALDNYALGQVAHAMGGYSEAEQYLKCSLMTAREVGDPLITTLSYLSLGNVYRAIGEHDRAQQHYREGLLHSRRVNLHTQDTDGLHDSGKSLLVEALSPRELEVLELIVGGYTNQEIAGHLCISINTVKKHINHIFSKLEVTTRSQAIVRAQRLNMLT